jgi:hypothetical protein
MSNEFQGGSVNYPGCSYNTLCKLPVGANMAPVQGVPSMSCQIIPNWTGRPSYDALTHGVPSCSMNCGGHFNLKNAYPWPCKTGYHVRPCTSGCGAPVCNGGGPTGGK